MDRQKATGIATGITLAAVGGVSAIVLTAGPSIAAAFNGDEPAAVVSTETDPGVVEPTVVVIDENGNVVTPDAQMQASDSESDVGQAAAYDEHEEHEEHDEYDEHEEEYEEDEHEEYEDEDEDDDYEDDESYEEDH